MREINDELKHSSSSLISEKSFISSIESIKNTPSRKWNIYIFALLSSISLFTFGFHLAILNAPSKIFIKYSSKEHSTLGETWWSCFQIPGDAESWTRGIAWSVLVAIMFFGALLGSSFITPLTKSFFRNSASMMKPIIAHNLVFISGALIFSFAWSYRMLIIGRLLIGMGVGAACVQVQIYLPSIASGSILITGMGSIGVVLGIAAVEILAVVLKADQLGGHWRHVAWVDLGLHTIQVLLLILLFKHRPLEAIVNEEEEESEAKSTTTKNNESTESARLGIPASLSNQPSVKYKKSLSLAIFLHIAQQVSGINGLLSFSASIFKGIAYSSILIACINVLGSVLSFTLVNRLGRRTLVLWSTGGMALSALCLCLSEIMLKGNNQLSSTSSSVKVAFVLAFVLLFSVGMGPIPWLILSELFPPDAHRHRLASWAVMTNWIATMVVIAAFLPLFSVLGQLGTFMLLAVVNGVLFGVSYVVMVETRGKSPAYIQ